MYTLHTHEKEASDVKKRILPMFLALVMLLTLLPAPLASAAGTSVYNGTNYSTDYTTWRQGDPAWGKTPLGDLHTFGGSGCLISSIAVLMCHSGAYDPASLNPGTLRDWLDKQGYISHSQTSSQDALLSFGQITYNTSPRFYFTNQEFFSTDTPMADIALRVSQLQASGYYVIARVKYSGHFVAVDQVVGSDVKIFDSGASAKKLLSEYNGTIGGLICFKANLSGKDTVLPAFGLPTAPKVADLADAYGTGDKIAISWGAANLATHYNLYVEQKQANGSWKENYRYHFYVISPFSLEPLPAGTYRVKVQATNANANPWTYTNSDWQTFQVKQGYLTVTYDANGGTVANKYQLAQAWTKYQLPTPTKSGAAFLGWYNASGKPVNNSSLISTTSGHTLTAKWTNTGVGFHKNASYNGIFWDVPKNAWYYDSIANVYAYGLMNGVEPTKFEPTSQVTAAQTITLAARMRKLFVSGSGSFASTSPWYKAYSDYALSQGIIGNLPADINGTLTRQEFAAMIANALPNEALPAVNIVPFGSIPDVYRSDASIYKLYRAGILAGNDSAGTFLPNAPITRAEVATILVRMADPNARVLFSLS